MGEVCEFWKELDDDNGDFEYCRKVNRRCSCCGTLSQCCYPKEKS